MSDGYEAWLPRHPTAVRLARAIAPRWPVSAQIYDDLAVLSSEAVSVFVRAAPLPADRVRLKLTRTGSTVRGEVIARRAAFTDADEMLANTGVSWRLIELLASDCGVTPRGAETVVWFERSLAAEDRRPAERRPRANAAVVEHLIIAVELQDWRWIEELLHPDIVVSVPYIREPLRGYAQVRSFHERFGPVTFLQIERLDARGSHGVFAHGSAGLSPTGEAGTFTVASAVRRFIVDEGRVRRLEALTGDEAAFPERG